jgi:hypothetical protein
MAIASRVDTIIGLLSEQEKKRLIPWLELFYGEKRPFVPIFCRQVLKRASEKATWQAAFPGKPFNKAKYHRRCFILADALDQYLISLEVLRSENEAERLLLQAYNTRGEIELLDRAQQRLHKKLFQLTGGKDNDSPSLPIESLRLAHDLATARQILLTTKGKLTVDEGIRDLNNTFDTWWLHEKLYLSVLTLYYNFSSEIPELPFLSHRAIEEAAKLVPKDIQTETKGMLSLRFLYHLITDILLKPRDLSRDKIVIPILFSWLDRLGFQHKPLPYSLANFFYLLIGINVNRSNQTPDIELKYFYWKQIWELYIWGIRHRILLQNGVLPYTTFTSLLSTAFRLSKLREQDGGSKQLMYYQNSLEQLLDLLPAQERHDAKVIGDAMIHFYQKNYSKTQRLLSVKFKQPLFEVLGRTYLYQSMYEQYWMHKRSDFEDLRDYANSLKRYIDRASGLSDSFRERMKNFCLFYDKLCKDYRRDRLPALEQRMQKTSALAHRDWLILKVRQKLEAKKARKR